ncbi:phosphotriesterase-related protein [Amycolatopsis acidicola]|uniref:Phosphotriesterase-related protein n=1 Tax=Amycolatopsis acidicola TaxID=2596893 RepID=A0A5N0UY24_9PSEU|nr:phosphotriesterase-related protein [Amycolatopsis acidicola]KAA9158105.1 phosphotriesterase-related protein [Amycolatopsis acidicola]
MTRVSTVTGGTDSDRLGRVLMHEHVFVLNHEYELNYPEVWDARRRTDDAVAKLVRLKEAGIDTIVDLTVLGLGRDIRRVRAVAERSPVQIIAATGFYTFSELPGYLRLRGPGRMLGGEEPMTGMFVRDIEEGIAGTGIKAAILKCATDVPGVTPDVERVLRSVARAHLRTGVPISTHTDVSTQRGLEQQKIFAEEGVDPGRVIIGHSGDSDDLGYLQRLLDNGSYLGMDRFGLEAKLPFEKRVRTVAALVERGYAGRMVLSHDASCHSHNFPDAYRSEHLPDWRYTHITEDVIPALLEAGVSQADIDVMLVDNPREIFAAR